MIMAVYMRKLVGRLFKFFNYKANRKWQDIEYFDIKWKERISVMSKFIDSGAAVVDLGCGEMWLRECISENEIYIPVDYKFRDKDTIICDFNNYEYPDINADTAFISGCLEYIDDYKWFISKICQNHNKCILSYCTIDNFPSMKSRTELTWRNHLSKVDIISLFEENYFYLENEGFTKTKNQILVLKK
jgi:hypothetical protein